LAIYLLQIQLTCIFEHFEYFFIFLLLVISALYLNLIFQLFGIILQKYKCISGETFLGGICFHVAAFLIFWNTFPLMMAEKTAEMFWQMEYSIFIVKYNKRFYLYAGADPGFVVRGAWVGDGSENGLRSPAGPRQSTGRGPRGDKPPGSSRGLRNYRHLFERQFWTNHTIFIRPKKPDFES
jgi:hypothetical protein